MRANGRHVFLQFAAGGIEEARLLTQVPTEGRSAYHGGDQEGRRDSTAAATRCVSQNTMINVTPASSAPRIAVSSAAIAHASIRRPRSPSSRSSVANRSTRVSAASSRLPASRITPEQAARRPGGRFADVHRRLSAGRPARRSPARCRQRYPAPATGSCACNPRWRARLPRHATHCSASCSASCRHPAIRGSGPWPRGFLAAVLAEACINNSIAQHAANRPSASVCVIAHDIPPQPPAPNIPAPIQYPPPDHRVKPPRG